MNDYKITVKDVLSNLEKYQATDGFESLRNKEDPTASIFSYESIVITRDEWDAAFVWSNISTRTVATWWQNFIKIKYLIPIPDEKKTMILNIPKIKNDIEIRMGMTPDQFLGMVE